MSPTNIVDTFKQDGSTAISHFQEEVKKLRTGRAHPSMVESVQAMAYGVPTPLIQLATITTPEPQLIQISPFDPTNLKAISEAIRNNQSLGLNPTDDGRVVRLQIPPLTTERRQQIVKQLNEKVEETMIRLRSARHESLDKAKEEKNAKRFTEDDLTWLQKQIDEHMAKVKSEIDGIAKSKETEIMTV